MKLWLVTVHSDDFEYDYFSDGVVWAKTAEEAEKLIREYEDPEYPNWGDRFSKGSRTRLEVTEAPTSGVVTFTCTPG